MIWIILALLLLVFQIAAVVIFEYSRPYKAVTWVVILFLFPLFGYLLYFFIGKEYILKRPINPADHIRLEQVREHLSERCERQRIEGGVNPAALPNDRIHSILEHAASFPVAVGNETTVYAAGEEAFEDMLQAISLARHHIHIEFYIIRDDELGFRFQQLLIQKAKEGVKVKLMYDGIGSHKLRKSFVNRLHEAGVETGCFSPPLISFFTRSLNYRNHRKIVVVDGRIGYFGGLNIGDEYLGKDPKIGYWRDTHFRIEGNAVWWIQYTFLTDWYFVKGILLADPEYYPLQESKGKEWVQIVKSGPDKPILNLFFSCFVSAKRRIYIESPYFVLEPGVILALKTAAISGVDVKVILPAVPDSKVVYLASLSYIQELLQTGARFFLYEKGFIHSKVVIADDLACSGSANMDNRSFCGQFELNAIFYDGKTVNQLVRDFCRDLSASKEIELSQYEKRPQLQKYKEAFARLFSPLF
ncbi:cardiolipin synthase [Paenibacillus oralis]|uniref:cardiolipin synthase n=1 Tax=Paenibacillus oralis TaxID=2490856 RepID=UPI0015ACFCB6|nr:cardiolipin synthase [Paenibacillus oralis]